MLSPCDDVMTLREVLARLKGEVLEFASVAVSSLLELGSEEDNEHLIKEYGDSVRGTALTALLSAIRRGLGPPL